MPLYPEPDLENATAVLTHVNNISGGAFALGIPISIFSIIMIIGIITKRSLIHTFIGASFTFTIISMLLAFGKYLNPIYPLAGVFLIVIGYIINRISNN